MVSHDGLSTEWCKLSAQSNRHDLVASWARDLEPSPLEYTSKASILLSLFILHASFDPPEEELFITATLDYTFRVHVSESADTAS